MRGSQQLQPNNRSARTLVVALASLTAIGMVIAGFYGPPSAAGQASPAAATTSQATAAGPTTAERRTHPCPHNPQIRCGQLKVALDPTKPAGRKISVRFVLVPRSNKVLPSRGTIVAVEGGPGYASTASLAYYRDLYEPMLDRRQMLLIDQRGTGSSAIFCKRLQSYRGNRVNAVGKCGKQLGNASDLYGSAFAADDMVAVLDHLGIGKIDLYGDSYGTYYSQTFAVRHPDRVRTVTLDASYDVAGTDPWYSDTNRALRYAFTIACKRSPSCAALPTRPMSRIAALADRLREAPIVGMAADAEGVTKRVRVTVNSLVTLLTDAATSPTIYRELDAAARAVLRPHPYMKPLLRLTRESIYVGGAGPVRQYSEAMFLAVSCNDYPQPFDIHAPMADRPRQFQQETANLRNNRPRLFAPFTTKEWINSGYGYFDDCLRWPKPSHWVPAVPRNATWPDVPVLVLNGDLDSLTSPEGGKASATRFPNATFVSTANLGHVSAIIDFNQCASVLVRRFVRTLSAGDTSCAADYHENRLVERFAQTAADTGWNGLYRRTARITNATLADTLARWYQAYGSSGVGLQGGTFHYTGGAFSARHSVAKYQLDGLKWVKDVEVSGWMNWHRRTGDVIAEVTLSGPGTQPAHLRLTWNDLDKHAEATAAGTIGGTHVRLTFPSA